MRWKPKCLNHGDERVIDVFLLIPRTIGDETRWLEWAKIKQTLRLHYGDATWKDMEFIDGP